jgi:hypothetical protein
MTFEEAQKLKATFDDKIMISGIEYDVFVVPADQKGWTKYITYERRLETTDESALKYSCDFEVKAIKFMSRDILFHLLPLPKSYQQ